MESNSNELPTHVDPDVALMLRVRDDDAVAFELLVARYQGRIGRLMQGWVNSQEVAEDLVQEVFLRVFRARKTYQPTAKLTTWIYRIANNVASNSVRDRSRRKEYQIGKMTGPSTTNVGIEHIALAASGAMPGRLVDTKERSNMVKQAVQALGERQRMAMMLSKFEGLSYQEIADTMGLSVKAVKSLLSRARVNLKLLLQPYVDEGMLPRHVVPHDDATVEMDVGSLPFNRNKSKAAEVPAE
ncbi:MAG: sigma-70 family RNA polymerase sigma factor [Pirellulaceae bacterium]|nr:sigma-70 family RNA polymerase sigma factor [Pirellulaceae bacterium]